MAMSKNQHLLSKIATNDRHGENSPYFDGWKAYDNNPYHPIDNREGVIQMGLAENQLCFDLIQKWLRRNPKARPICTAEGVHEFKNIAIFQDYHGFKEFRQAVANFMCKARGGRVTFNPSRLVMTVWFAPMAPPLMIMSGVATGANETVMFCLANPGDTFLVPSPCYPAFPREGLISNLIFCETHLDDSFTIINRVIWVVIICLPPIKVRRILTMTIIGCNLRQKLLILTQSHIFNNIVSFLRFQYYCFL